ncbi:MAG: F0F1 ATP synthase subunit gamma [bacterium]|nr:F0F1 ATP synthase subunit gamma [bacterium]
MRSKDIKSELNFLGSFAALADGLEQVSMVKMQDIRDYIERSRQFHEGLGEIYRDVKYSSTLSFNKKRDVTLKALRGISLPEKKRSVTVLLSANTRLYGTIVDEVYSSFYNATKESKDDIVIIGKIGKEKYDREESKREYQYFDLKDSGIIYLDLLSILGYILNYSSITVYYGQFNDIFSQQPVHKTVGADPEFNDKSLPTDIFPSEQFFLEPSPKELESFFSGQVIGLLFRQAAYEFELARHASRIQTLEQALGETLLQQRQAKQRLGRLRKNGESNRQAYTLVFSTHKNR